MMKTMIDQHALSVHTFVFLSATASAAAVVLCNMVLVCTAAGQASTAPVSLHSTKAFREVAFGVRGAVPLVDGGWA
jgi:hypothetical protein